LAKLGYALHQDGVYGGTTRQAIEKFERSNGLPVKGELSPKILRLLGARAGVAFK
jgi:peptidoglycan hydrolase-like protein with peptidoglycan-binding domain